MARAFNAILVILVSLAFLIAGSGLLGTLLAVRMSLEGFSQPLIGPILAFHSLGFVLGTQFCMPVIRRVGHIRSFAAFAAIACVAALIHPMRIDPFTWAVLRMVSGFCGAGLAMVMESWINDRTSNDLRGTVMAFYMATNYLAQGSGQFLLGLGEPDTTYLFMVAAALIATSLVPLALTRSRAPVLERHERMSLARLYRVAPTGMVGAFLGGMAMSGFLSMLPVYAHLSGYPFQQISILMGLMVLFGMATQWPIGYLSDRYDRRTLIVLLALLATLASIPLGLRDVVPFNRLLLLGGLFVGLAGTLYPMCVALTNDYLQSHQMVSASSTLLLTFGVGTIIGPIGASTAITLLGPQGLFVFVGAATVVLASWGLGRHLVSRRFPVEKQQHYVPVAMGNNTPVILEIDPRNLEFEPSVVVPPYERRQGGQDRRGGYNAGGRRRTDAMDANE